MGRFFEFMGRVCCRACLVTGPIFITLALGFGIYTGLFLHGSVAADGTVVSLDLVRDNENNSLTYSPVFTFAATDGNAYIVSDRKSTRLNSSHLGISYAVF